MGEGRKRVLTIVAGILVPRNLNNTGDLHSRRSHRQSQVADCIRRAVGGSNHEKHRRNVLGFYRWEMRALHLTGTVTMLVHQ